MNIEYKCSLTVKHILLECYNLQNIHEKYFTCSSLKELFASVDAATVMDFFVIFCGKFVIFDSLSGLVDIHNCHVETRYVQKVILK